MIIYNDQFITFNKCRNDPLLAAQNSKDSFSLEMYVIKKSLEQKASSG